MGQLTALASLFGGPALATLLLIISARLLTSFVSASRAASAVPLIGAEYGSVAKRRKAYLRHAGALYKKGYEQFRDKVYRITTADDEHYVIPRHMVEEIRSYPEDVINGPIAFERLNEKPFLDGMVGNNPETQFILQILRTDLTRSLGRINPRLTAEIARGFATHVGSCDEWTPYVLQEKLSRVVSQTMSAIIVGPELYHKEEYLKASTKYDYTFFKARALLKEWPPWLRWLGQYFVPELKVMRQTRAKLMKLLLPVAKDRLRMMGDGKEMPDDLIQWILNKQSAIPLKTLVRFQIDTILAAIHTSSLSTVMLLYDIIIRPHIIDEIRAEVESVLADNGGELNVKALSELKYMDSVMKESQRFNPGTFTRFVRWVGKPVVLSDGTPIPAGSIVSCPYGEIVRDPKLYPDPETFNPRRFLDLRNSAASDSLNHDSNDRYQYVTVTKDFMSFGYGRNVCPGRFFAANVIKIVIAHIVLNYDIKMPDGLTDRYVNISSGMIENPDITKEVLFRKRRTAA